MKTKALLIFVFFVSFRFSAVSQNVGISAAGTVPDNTAMLDVVSTTRGMLIPRMTTAERDLIGLPGTPATGLQIYNTDCKVVNYYTGTCWISMSKALPDPRNITSVPASTVFCANQIRDYSIPAVMGATYYTWTVPAGAIINSGQGTTAINVTFGNISGNVCVKASNACETSGQTCLTVNVDPIPNTPGNITGLTTINPGATSVNYYIASVNGAGAYTWAYSGTGFTITSGTGTTSITVNYSCTATSGTLSVTANSSCGASPASSLAITVTPILAVNAGVDKFGGTTIGSTATGGAGGYAYSWSPAGDLSNSTDAIPTALCTGSTTTYTVTVTDANTCTATDAVVVTRTLAANAGADLSMPSGCSRVIGGSPQSGSGGAGSYTYSWSPTTALSPSAIVSNPTSSVGSTTTYTVTVTDANGCTATDPMTLTVGGGTSVPFTTVGSTTWTVPGGVTCITIETWGAQGGTSGGNAGGLGARMRGTFTVTAGQVLKIMVGGQGAAGTQGGGGGGSFVTDNSNNPLCIAGGGGGAYYSSYSWSSVNMVGTTSTSGQAGVDGANSRYACSGGAGGAGGGSQCWYTNVGAGGGGLTGNGVSGGGAGGGQSFINGGAGGGGAGSGGGGGFGGGGGGDWWSMTGGGGGGGYSGGGGGEYYGVGGGGGSFNNGAAQSNSSGVQSGNGQIVITY